MTTEGCWAQPAFAHLGRIQHDLAVTNLRDLFAHHPGRTDRFSVDAARWHFDYSRHLVTDDVVATLCDLARQCGVGEHTAAMFGGATVNTTEQRAALHAALRLPATASVEINGEDAVAQIHGVLADMARFADAVRNGTWTGATGKRIRHVVNVGIGGSDLGPAMATSALAPFADPAITVDFVSNVDDHDLREVLARVDPAATLFIVVSKTFTTVETMTNARSARAWLVDHLGDVSVVGRHMVAVSANAGAVAAFGIDPDNMFDMWDWVGGRYSVASAVGLAVMVAIGPDRHADLLAGMHAMDTHFLTAPFEANLPVLMGMLGVWYRNLWGWPTTAVMPYDARLARFPAYLQQLSMESLGKSVTVSGQPVPGDTGPVVWGEPGTNGQHSFFQLLHQGTTVVPVDFIVVARGASDVGDHRRLLVANALAQSAALAFGRTATEVAATGTPAGLVAHRVMPGNRPSGVLWTDELTPFTLGSLVALYEHAVFTEAVVWGINPFDQWGVELGKELAGGIAEALAGGPTDNLDASTVALVDRYRRAHGDGGGDGSGPAPADSV